MIPSQYRLTQRTHQQYQTRAKIYDRRGRVLAVGHNSFTKTHTLQAYWARRAGEPMKIYTHAEIAAIARCRAVIDRAYRIEVSRYGTNGEPRLARPCPICMGAILSTNIQLIEYTDPGSPTRWCEKWI